MNILLLGGRGTPEEGGGYTLANDIFETVLKNCGQSQHRFFLLEYSHDAPEPDMSKNVTVIRVSRRNMFLRILRRLAFELGVKTWRGEQGRRQATARWAIKAHQLDCVLALSPWDGVPSIPTVVIVWDLEHRRKPYFPELGSNREWETREGIYRSILPRAIAVITGTETGKKQIQHFFGIDPEIIRVIPFPTPSFALAHIDRAEQMPPLPDNISGDFLFYPAQYWPHKNHIRLLEALKILQSKHDWRGSVVFCGADKGNLQYLKARVRDLNLENQVRFLGFLTQSELIALYQRAFALAFVSYLGPDNLPPLEAFALGCPVIASDVAGAREALGDSAAIYINPDSASDIAAAVLRLRNEPQLKVNLIQKGKERAARHSAKEYVEQLIRIFDALEVRFGCYRKPA